MSATSTDRSRWRYSLWLPVLAVAAYVTIPLLASMYYALFPGGQFSLRVFEDLAADASLTAAVTRTLLITVLTIAILIATLVPAVVAVHLWAPRLRPLLEVMCTLPLVVPTIALAAGVIALLRWGAQQGRGSAPSQVSQFLQTPDLPLILVGTYVVLCLPFTFRSVDAGLRTIPLKAIVEGSASLGSSTWGTIWRIVIPNIRGPVLFSIFFATAVCFGEFAVAATLNIQTVPVWMFTVSSTNFRASIAVAVVLSLATWALLLIAAFSAERFSAEGRGARRSRATDPIDSTVPAAATSVSSEKGSPSR